MSRQHELKIGVARQGGTMIGQVSYAIEQDLFTPSAKWIVTHAGRYRIPDSKPGDLVRYRINDDGTVIFPEEKESK